jgi:hypothetical protein
VKDLEVTRRLLINKEGIGFFKAILESYEDVAIFSVLDGREGLIELNYPVFFEQEITAIMEDMKYYGITFREVADV